MFKKTGDAVVLGTVGLLLELMVRVLRLVKRV